MILDNLCVDYSFLPLNSYKVVLFFSCGILHSLTDNGMIYRHVLHAG